MRSLGMGWLYWMFPIAPFWGDIDEEMDDGVVRPAAASLLV